MSNEHLEAIPLTLLKPAIEQTGDARVDAALERLADTEPLPIGEQVDVFDEVHRRLQDALAQSHE